MRVRYLTQVKNDMWKVVCYKMFFAHSYAKIKVDSYEFLSLKKALTFHNVIIFLKSIFSKYKYNAPVIYS